MSEQVDLDMLRQALERDEREFGKSWSRDVVRDLLSERDSLAAELRQERERADEAEKLLGMVSGVAASSIPETSLRGKPMAAVVGLSVTLSRAEAALSRAEETIEAVEDLVTRHYLDTHMGERVLEILDTYDQKVKP